MGTFGFAVRGSADGSIMGNLQYINHVTRARVYSVTFTSLAIAANTATFEGTCTINRTPCTFAVTVTDRGEPGTGDTFVITISSAPPDGGVLRGGNIRIHE